MIIMVMTVSNNLTYINTLLLRCYNKNKGNNNDYNDDDDMMVIII